jgi:hypothetical protein
MDCPELEQKLKEARLLKQEMVKDLTKKCIDAINLSEQCTKTQMLLLDDKSGKVKDQDAA